MSDDVKMLTAAVAEQPDDAVAAGALYDALQETGTKPLTARRTVNRIVRDAGAAKLLAEVTALVAAPTVRGRKLRQRLRDAAGEGHTRCPVDVVAGSAAPKAESILAHHRFRGSNAAAHPPGAAIRHGFRLADFRSILRVVVGAEWVRNHTDDANPEGP